MSACQNCGKSVFRALNSYGEQVIVGFDGSLVCITPTITKGHR